MQATPFEFPSDDSFPWVEYTKSFHEAQVQQLNNLKQFCDQVKRPCKILFLDSTAEEIKELFRDRFHMTEDQIQQVLHGNEFVTSSDITVQVLTPVVAELMLKNKISFSWCVAYGFDKTNPVHQVALTQPYYEISSNTCGF